MPPPDTTYLPLTKAVPIPAADSPRIRVIDQYFSGLTAQGEGPHYLFPEWVMFLIVMLILLLLYLYQDRVAAVDGMVRQNIRRRKANRLLLQKGNEYAELLAKYNPYYVSLSKEMKNRFLFRMAEFMQSKKFNYHSISYEEYIPVLISGAAVQITFGLKNFLMDYFSVVHVIGEEYVLENDNANVYFGHVSKTGIHVAWNHFLDGYKDYSDSVNVGLHEMAHAVSYDVFLGEENRHDRKFKRRLESFSEKGKPVFRALRKDASHILSDYGATNFDEFWAVCIEAFFENPVEFKRKESDLYISICGLLNQDPLLKEKIIDRKLAGISVKRR